jgi:hypothetical protein
MIGRPICAAIAVFGAGRELISQGRGGIPHLQGSVRLNNLMSGRPAGILEGVS